MTKTKREREKKAFYQRLFIKYSPVTKFCKASKGENRGSAVRHPAEKSSPGDEPHYLSIRRPENQANHTTNRRPITAPQNCSSTNQVLIPSSKKIEKSALSCCATGSALATRKQTQPCFWEPSFNSGTDCHVCTIHPLIYFYSYLDKAWPWDHHFSGPSQALKHNPRDTVLSSCSNKGLWRANQPQHLFMLGRYKDRFGKVYTETQGVRTLPLQWPHSPCKLPKALLKTKLMLLQERRTGLWAHQRPTVALSQMSPHAYTFTSSFLGPQALTKATKEHLWPMKSKQNASRHHRQKAKGESSSMWPRTALMLIATPPHCFAAKPKRCMCSAWLPATPLSPWSQSLPEHMWLSEGLD